MKTEDYRHSLRTRLRVLFSPVRLVAFGAALTWLVVLNVIFISNLGQPEWAGPASVAPVILWLVWMMVTDRHHRRNAARRSGAQAHPKPGGTFTPS